MSKFVLEIETDNAAFDAADSEIVRLLRNAADRIEGGEVGIFKRVLMDHNGNSVGFYLHDTDGDAPLHPTALPEYEQTQLDHFLDEEHLGVDDVAITHEEGVYVVHYYDAYRNQPTDNDGYNAKHDLTNGIDLED